MAPRTMKYVYGPVISRRLGRSLGVDPVPFKTCNWNCIYCQLGRTTMMTKNRSEFYDPQKIYRAVQKKVAKALESGVQTDYLTFVPDGEPTLDINLGKAIDLLKLLGIPIGVISNSSLMWRTDVREELARADWVSLKVDAFEDRTWRRINRPEVYLQHFSIQGGMAEFTKYFSGRLVTETMLIKNLNDNDDQLRDMADYIAELEPHTAYISIPVRPPLEKWVHRPDEDRVNKAFQIFSDKLPRVECLIGYEGNAFAFTGDAEKDLLSITAVHPMRKSAVEKLLSKAGEPWDLVENLIAAGDLKESLYEGHAYYLRTFGP